jgi:hypothetical protein
MVMRRLTAPVAAAAMLVEVASADVLAGAFNDPSGAVRDGERLEGVAGSTLRIRISYLRKNDTGKNKRFLRAFKIAGNIDDGGNNPSSAGIKSITGPASKLRDRLLSLHRSCPAEPLRWSVTPFRRRISKRQGGVLIIRFRKNFEGDTSFKYAIRTRGDGESRANVFIRVSAVPSPG